MSSPFALYSTDIDPTTEPWDADPAPPRVPLHARHGNPAGDEGALRLRVPGAAVRRHNLRCEGRLHRLRGLGAGKGAEMNDSYYEKCVCGAEIGTEITPDTLDWVRIWVQKHRNCSPNYVPPSRKPRYTDPYTSGFYDQIRAKILENESGSCE